MGTTSSSNPDNSFCRFPKRMYGIWAIVSQRSTLGQCKHFCSAFFSQAASFGIVLEPVRTEALSTWRLQCFAMRSMRKLNGTVIPLEKLCLGARPLLCGFLPLEAGSELEYPACIINALFSFECSSSILQAMLGLKCHSHLRKLHAAETDTEAHLPCADFNLCATSARYGPFEVGIIRVQSAPLCILLICKNL